AAFCACCKRFDSLTQMQQALRATIKGAPKTQFDDAQSVCDRSAIPDWQARRHDERSFYL
ncbi:MAG: hypothetical protein EBX69_11295, partial [Betaproteobacteria bacterium]|nr:hypothetical protein [Betaproteobacteria bacterium]